MIALRRAPISAGSSARRALHNSKPKPLQSRNNSASLHTTQANLDGSHEQLTGRILRDLEQYHRHRDANTSVPEAQERATRELGWLVDHLKSSKHRQSLADFSDQQVKQLQDLVRRVVQHDEPFAYVLGTQPFGPIELTCRPPVLIPRPETEAWTLNLASRLIQYLAQPHCRDRTFRILDLCTGSGCIGLLLHYELSKASEVSRSSWQVVLADNSEAALELARANCRGVVTRIESEGTHNQGALISPSIEKVDLFADASISALLARYQSSGSARAFDLVVCNPPYISRSDYLALDPSVRRWEDPKALIGEVMSSTSTWQIETITKMDDEGDGLEFYRRLAALLPALSRTTSGRSVSELPFLVMEVGHEQARAVQLELLSDAREGHIEIWRDAWNRERVVAVWI